jgi:phosphoenolpyruvate-protein kinase (PTS system EI component)
MQLIVLFVIRVCLYVQIGLTFKVTKLKQALILDADTRTIEEINTVSFFDVVTNNANENTNSNRYADLFGKIQSLRPIKQSNAVVAIAARLEERQQLVNMLHSYGSPATGLYRTEVRFLTRMQFMTQMHLIRTALDGFGAALNRIS